MPGRLVRGAVVAAAVLLIAVACVPVAEPPAGAVTAAALGPLVRVDWDASSDNATTRYQVKVDGSSVADVAAPATSCVLTGLAASATVTIGVAGFNAADGSTGSWDTATHLTSPEGGAGSTVDCVPTTDEDDDRLPDAVETGTGVYASAADTGTDPTVADTDGDIISDGDEVLNTTGGLGLRAMGVSPLKKDLILEFDWFDDNSDPEVCGAHSHRPTPASIARVADAFAAGPATNPDGTTGVHLIADYGQGGAFTGGNLVADADGLLGQGVPGDDFDAVKSENLAANRIGYVHYVLNVHRFNLTSNSSGQAEVNGDDLVVSLRCSVSNDDFVANTIVHEVGHNLGLGHGGDSDLNWKPNYNSVMNYRYQFAGVDTDCDGEGDGKLDLSAGVLPALDEFHLLEADGVCGPGGPGIDWNWNGVLDPEPVPVSINGDSVGDVLTDFDDWSALDFSGMATGGGQRRAQPEVIIEQPVPE